LYETINNKYARYRYNVSLLTSDFVKKQLYFGLFPAVKSSVENERAPALVPGSLGTHLK